MGKSLRGDFAEHLAEFEVDGLRGRCWDAPALRQRRAGHTIIIVYGHHSSLERNLGLAQYLRRYGRVVMPDLPGLGGMDSFYSQGNRPTLDNYADFLNSFLRLKFKRAQAFSIFGFSLGFLVATRFLQKYPDNLKRLRLLVSVAGFVRGDALKFSPARRFYYDALGRFASTRPGAAIFKRIFLGEWSLRHFYDKTFLAKSKFSGSSARRRRELMEMELRLWRCNDVRTWAFTGRAMLACDLTGQPLQHRLYQLSASGDQFLAGKVNLRGLKKVYNEVEVLKVEFPKHAPTVITDTAEMEAIMPSSLTRLLKKESTAGR